MPHIMEKIQQAEVGFRSLTKHIDSTSPAGHMLIQIVSSFAEFERAIIRERTLAQGRNCDRKLQLNKRQKSEIIKMVNSDRKNASQTTRIFNVHPETICRLLMQNSSVLI